MAELHVQPKKSTNWLIWLLLALIAIVVLFFLLKGCNTTVTATRSTDSTATNGVATTTTPSTTTTQMNEGDIDFQSPVVNYEEITDKDVSVRSNDRYAIYSLGNNILFDVDKSNIRPNAVSKLKQISSSLGKRYAGGKIDVYGYADSTGDADHNKKLSEQRAEAVKSWIVKNAQVDEASIELHPMGESDPVASNATEQGKQENRSVRIVARKK